MKFRINLSMLFIFVSIIYLLVSFNKGKHRRKVNTDGSMLLALLCFYVFFAFSNTEYLTIETPGEDATAEDTSLITAQITTSQEDQKKDDMNTKLDRIIKMEREGDDPLLYRLFDKAKTIFDMSKMPCIENFMNFEPYRQTSSIALSKMFSEDPIEYLKTMNDDPTNEDPFNDMIVTIFNYVHPESPRYQNPILRERIIKFFTYHIANLRQLVFSLILHYSVCILFMAQAKSDLLDALKQPIIALYRETEREIDKILPISDPETENFTCTNIHFRIVAGLYILGLANNDLRMVNKARAFLSTWNVLPHGAMLYTGNSNEIYTYHHANMQILLYLHCVTPKETFFPMLIEKCKWYMVTQLHPTEGATEYITAGIWKKMWSPPTRLSKLAPWVTFLITRDKWSAFLSRGIANGTSGHYWDVKYSSPLTLRLITNDLLACHAATIKDVKMPMNQLGEDLNINGFRIRNATSEVVCTIREPSFPPMKVRSVWDGCGLRSIIGMMCVGNNGVSMVHSVLESICFGIKQYADDISSGRGVDFDTLLLTTYKIGIYKIQGSYNILKPLCSTVAVVHGTTLKNSPLSEYDWIDLPLRGTQVYIASPGKLTGFIRITATQNFTCKDLRFFLVFLSGRGVWGIQRKITQNADGTFTYGNMKYKLTTTLENRRDITGSIFGNSDTKAIAQSYGVKDSNNSTPFTVKRGETWTIQLVCVETTKSFNDILEIKEGNGLLKMATKEGTVVFNTTQNEIQCSTSNVCSPLPSGYYTSSLTRKTTQVKPTKILPFEHYTIIDAETSWAEIIEDFK